MQRKELRAMEPVYKDSTTRRMWKVYDLIPCQGQSKWTVHDKFEALMVYTVSGSLRKVEKKTKIPRTVVRQWMRSPWWGEAYAACMELVSNQYVGRLNAIMDKATAALEERLEEGDMVLTRDGLKNVPVNAKTLMGIAAQAAAAQAKLQPAVKEESPQGNKVNKKLLDLNLALAEIARQNMANQGTSYEGELSKEGMDQNDIEDAQIIEEDV